MKDYRFFYEGQISFTKPVADHQFLLRCQPFECEYQHLLECNVELEPPVRTTLGGDAFGNRLLYGHQTESHTFFNFRVTGMLRQTDYVISDSVSYPMYRMPSPLTMVQPVLKVWTEELRLNLPEEPLDKAIAVAEAVHKRLKYDCTLTNCNTTAAEAVLCGGGVCQDFAHVTLALCRQLGLTVRYVNGFMLGEGFSHAWVEVHDGTAWHGIDPTNNCPAGYGYLKVAHGRDANDCPLNRGVFSGFTWQTMQVKVVVEEVMN